MRVIMAVMRRRLALVVLLAVGLGACALPSTTGDAGGGAAGSAEEPDEDDDITTAMGGIAFATVPEAYVTAATPDDNVDSPASWQPGDDSTWLIATAKATDRLMVYDGDSGAFVRGVGGSGKALGQFRRPNGVFVVDDLVFVVERDNGRVQVLRLPAFAPLGSFGAPELVQPYGVWLRKTDGAYDVIVSDAYMSAADEDAPPPLAQLDRRFKRYRVRVDATAVEATLTGTFGATDAAGAIRIPESLWGDPAHGRLLIAEEDQAIGTRVRVYDIAGRYAGRDIGAELFKAQAEGIALWACADGSGYWIATDQYKDLSVFHVFDRATLAPLGAFAGRQVANTDGVWLQQGATKAFPAGVFYAVDDDQGVGAFDWRDVARTLTLRETCDAR